MYAIVETGGKQYRVEKDNVIFVEKLDAKEGEKINLSVLMTSNEGKVQAGKDASKASVVAEVMGNVKGEKVLVFHYKAKKNIRKKQGHRQPYTKLKIVEINA